MNLRPRFAISAGAIDGSCVVLSGTELHHMRDVMRLRIGDQVALLDEGGVEHFARIVRVNREGATLEISSRSQPARCSAQMILAPAIIKGPRMDFMVEKAAELGASELWPIICARGLVPTPGPQRIARWRRLAMAAAKQSLSSGAMEVRPPRPFANLLQAAAPDTLAIVCVAGARPLGAVIRDMGPPRQIVIACGPEGDFDRDELELARQAGFVSAGLGRNRLRSETAAIAALSICAASLGEKDGEG